jgi:putative transcriptional regulator
MCRDAVMADVTVDYRSKSVHCVNHTEKMILRPFGIRNAPTIRDFERFLESRCFPRERRNCKQLLDDLGLDYYTPLGIVRKTHGRQMEDYCWIRFEGEKLDYERDIKLRD